MPRGGNLKPDKPRELLGVLNFYSPETPAAFVDKGTPPVDRGECSCSIASTAEEFHYLGICTDRGKRLPIFGAPLTKPKALCFTRQWL